MEVFIGMCVGAGLTLLFLMCVGLVLQEYMKWEPFRNVTVSDFQKKPEGG